MEEVDRGELVKAKEQAPGSFGVQEVEGGVETNELPSSAGRNLEGRYRKRKRCDELGTSTHRDAVTSSNSVPSARVKRNYTDLSVCRELLETRMQ